MIVRHDSARRFTQSGLFDGCESFKELEKRLEGLSAQDKGNAFEVFAEAYCLLRPTIDAKDVWPERTIPNALRQRLNLPARDAGCDGIIEHHGQRFTALQVKFRSARASPTWRELSTWIAISDRADDVLLFTNADKLPKEAMGRQKFETVRGHDLDKLTRQDLERIAALIRGEPIKRKTITPRPHQREAVKDIIEGLRNNDRATVLMACGTGKTLVALWVAETLKPKMAIVFVPSISLVDQLLEEWLKATSMKGLSFIAVCSDPTVAPDEDSLVMAQADLEFPVSTSPKDVRHFLDASSEGPKLVFCTYDSAWVVGKAMKKGERFDLGIFDEAHKTAGTVGRKYSYALTDKNLPIKKRVFMTATPRHYTTSKRNKEGDLALVFSMDSQEVYGPIVHELSFRAAVKQNLICDYKVVISVVTSNELGAAALAKGTTLVQGEELPARWVAHQVALKRAFKKTGVTKAFTFHESVQNAKDFAGEGAKGIVGHIAGLQAFHVNGKMSVATRDREMDAFRAAQKAVISNARCLTEGVDVPAVDMVAFISPRKSRIDIVQAVGRAMRRSNNNKTYGYVLIPLYLELRKAETIEAALKRQRFEAVWDTLEALKEQDEALDETIQVAAQELGEKGRISTDRLTRFVSIVGPHIGFSELERGIAAQLVEGLSVSWDVRYGQLVTYKAKHGDTDVPLGYHVNAQLGTWVANQRALYRRGILSKEHIARLERLGFVWDPFETVWNEMFLSLEKYKEKNGSTNVPQAYSVNPRLGVWVNKQRNDYRRSSLPEDRINRLERLGFAWEPHDAVWDDMFAELKKFRAKHGNTDVPRSYTPLSTWVNNQRALYRRGILPTERVNQLEILGFVWDPFQAVWDEMFAALKRYKKEHDNTNVPNNYSINPQLRTWVNVQRRIFAKGRLPSDRIDRLDRLGFSWDPREAAWNEMFAALERYKTKHGNTDVSRSYSINPQLSTWVNNQRAFFHRHSLSKDRIERLKRLGFVWDSLETVWNEMFEALKKYKAKRGNTNVPLEYSANPQLGNWVNTQRAFYRRDSLSKDRAKRLERLGFVWGPFEAVWNEMFLVLEKYKQKNGSTNVPQAYNVNPQLGRWVNRQRTDYRRRILSKERIVRLERLGFVWVPTKGRRRRA